MVPPTKILVGVDFSDPSDYAVQHAMAIARKTGAEVLLVYVSVEPEWPATLADPPKELAEYYGRVRELLGEPRARLEEIRERHSGQGVRLSHAVVDGFPETSLWLEARAAGADLVIVGSSGKSGLRWLTLGSVAQRVIRYADRDVLLARGVASPGGYRRICVATDFSPTAAVALDHACALAAPGATVDVVSAWSLPLFAPNEGTALNARPLIQSMLDDLSERGEDLVAPHRRPSLALTFRPLHGSAVATVIDHVTDERHDLLVVGSHGRRGVRRLILGSVAESVARNAPCAVLVARGSLPDDGSRTTTDGPAA